MNKHYIISAAAMFSIIGFTESAFAQYEACVGAKGAQKAGFCKYEYEAYLTQGSCISRGGGWVPGTSVTLNIGSPEELNQSRSGTRYVNYDARITGGCKRTCASTSITFQGRTYSKSTCDKKSYQ